MSSDDDLTVIIFMVLGTASAVAAAAGGFFGTRKLECQGEFTPWSPCVGECDEVPTRSRKYVITNSAPDCPYIDGYTETEACGPVSPCCEVVRDWEDPADVPCGENGLKKFTRELKENKPGACAGFETEAFAPCCKILGQFETVGECGDVEPGQQKYARDYIGECPAGEVETFEQCAPCVEGWDSYADGLPSCPPDAENCGYSGDTFKRTWQILASNVGTGKGCTENVPDEEVECPAQPPCCAYTTYSTDGVCASDGTLTYTRSYSNSPCKENPDAYNDKSYTDPCCYEAGDWAPVEGCVELQISDGSVDEEGNEVLVTVNRQKQVQTTAGCEEGTEERYVPCCGYTEWTPVGQCEELQVRAQNEFGITYQPAELQAIEREIVEFEGCGKEQEPFTESLVPCCGYSAWENDGSCTRSTVEGVEPSQQMIRQVIEASAENPCFPEQNTRSLQTTVDCCYEDEWAPVDYCTQDENSGEYKQQYQRNVFGAACDETNNPTTEYKTCQTSTDCPGSWDAYASGFPDCPAEDVCTDEITYNRTWVKEQAPAGTVYSNCPPDETKTCPAVPCDCVQGWDTSACPTEPGFLGNDPNKQKTWKITTTATGTGTCISDYEDGETAPCDATPAKQVACIGSWGEWDKACPTTETQCDYMGGEVETSRTWTTSPAPPGETYINCPPSTETETLTCPATEPCEIPCEGEWDNYPGGLPTCPTTETECGYAGGTFTRNWTTSPAPTGQRYTNCPPPSDSKTCPATGPCEIPCEGSWDDYPDGLPTSCPDNCGYGGETFTRNWTTTSPAPPGQAYANCPPPSESKTCPAVGACPSDNTNIIAGTAGAAAAIFAFCTAPATKDKCITYPVGGTPPSIRDDVDVNCVGQFDTDVPTCKDTCGEPAVTYTAKYEHIIAQQGGGALCPYSDGYQYTRSCQATPRCCTYSTFVTGSSVCQGAPGLQTINLGLQKSNEPCQEDGDAPTSKDVPCQNCYGFWEADACPTGCGYPGGTVTKNWVTLLSQDANGYGDACPTPTTMSCPATPPCSLSCPA